MRRDEGMLTPGNDGKQGSRENLAAALALDPATVLMVSVFMALFVFLAAITYQLPDKPEASGPVLKSLSGVFSPETSIAGESYEDATREPRLGDKVRSLVQSTFDNPVTVLVEDAGRFESYIDLESFFVEKTERIAPSKELFIKRLADLLGEEGNEGTKATLVVPGLGDDITVLRRTAALAATWSKYSRRDRVLSVRSSEGNTMQLTVSGGQAR